MTQSAARLSRRAIGDIAQVLLRSLLFNVALYVNFLVQAVVFSPVLLLPERMFWPIGRFWVASTLWLHRTITGIDDEIRGVENIPRGGFIVASKHQSAWETLRLTQLFPRPSFILKRQLLWLPLFGWYMWKAHMIPVDRGKGSVAIEAMLVHARRAIAEGRQIIIFPGGHAPAALRAAGIPPRRDAALRGARRDLPSDRAELRRLLAAPVAHASARHDSHADPSADPAGPAPGGIRRASKIGHRNRDERIIGRNSRAFRLTIRRARITSAVPYMFLVGKRRCLRFRIFLAPRSRQVCPSASFTGLDDPASGICSRAPG